ncbi:two-component system activity regulator YycH [Weissella tructae]|uniref:YycH family protein n=2 Tax=Weissella TaxID=46255 RepID=A0A075U4C7_9LACO|nr:MULTISPECIES: two-component system activity regulator YycH [Weissella]AIG64992.1 YycH family protein [Weissella tructae]AIM62304.1 YycH family protein [Weissella ceti]AIM63643.1 YycH family protein [Weissella ceti]ELA07816.1 yycH family protein [Weissella ceti NC36]QVV91404.1 hypothetical protein KHQ32_00360 [Weissella tructae]
MNRRKWRALLKQYLLIVVLMILVAVSLMLSFGIWSSLGDRPLYIAPSESADSDKRLVSEKDIVSVYDFDNVVVNQKGKQQLVMNSRSITREVLAVMGDWQINTVTAEKLDEKQYLKLMNEKNTVLLGYPDQVVGSLVESRLNLGIGLTDDDRVDRVQLPLSGKGQVRFFNDRTRDVYTASIMTPGTSLDDIKWPKNMTDVNFEWRQNRLRMNYLSETKLKTKSYLLDESKRADVVATAFKSARVTPYLVDTPDDKVEYTDGDTRRLVLNKQSGNVEMTEYDSKTMPRAMSSNMTHAYDTLVALKQVPENMYYFEELEDGMKLSYRLYVEGLPMFMSENFDFGTISVTYESNRQTVDYSVYGIQVPLPDKNEKTITLDNTETVMEKLTDAGVDTKKVQGLTMGYSWLENDEEGYITLQPAWFVQMKDEWLPVTFYTGAV